MYVPYAFAETDASKLHDFIEANSFGMLVNQLEGVPFATHLPFLLVRSEGPHGTLVGHMARANPQWKEMENATPLAVFSGPHAYISPTWYEAENVVPTWNYTAVHVYGKAKIIHDADAVLNIVRDTTAYYEASLPRPWFMVADKMFVDRMVAQIVGFRIEIERIEGKFKLNQNHPIERREKVVRALLERGGEKGTAVASMMQEQLHAIRGKA